ncbi:MAG: 16S rRNA (guanine(966)-N(2))-methyltransferase RsmD [Firmicutes bacterium]|nr:16S rRNA (guanine(966)-N(2))-methyltransferase RsmD [Bacillota bacterium]
MRIIGGQAAGRRLAPLRGHDTRPTGARVREALFDIWQARVVDALFLDAYAGTGAVGLEAVSRGARQVIFCEPRSQTRRTLYENIRRMGAQDRTVVVPKAVESVLPQWIAEGTRFEVVFCDPPWAQGLELRVRESLWRVVSPSGVVVLETRSRDPAVELPGLVRQWTRRYGDTALSQYVREDREGG